MQCYRVLINVCLYAYYIMYSYINRNNFILICYVNSRDFITPGE